MYRVTLGVLGWSWRKGDAGNGLLGHPRRPLGIWLLRTQGEEQAALGVEQGGMAS